MVPFWIIALVMAQDRPVSVVLPELQYTAHCSSEISLHNTSARFVDVDVVGHKSTGALVGLVDRRTNRLRLRPMERVEIKLAIENDAGWAEVIEIVPSPRLKAVLAVSGKTECVATNELVTAGREIAPVVSSPHFAIDHSAAALNGMVLLLINASDQPMAWTACYSGGTMISNGSGAMVPLCSEFLDRTLGPFQSWRLAASIDGNPLVGFRATGTAVAMQMLAPSAPQVRLYKVQSTIRFDEDRP